MMPHIFLFLEIFFQEGGIQSYIKDVPASLSHFARFRGRPRGFFLRDAPDCPNPFKNQGITFHYLKNNSATLGRIQLALKFLVSLLRKHPQTGFLWSYKFSSSHPSLLSSFRHTLHRPHLRQRSLGTFTKFPKTGPTSGPHQSGQLAVTVANLMCESLTLLMPKK
ncbi:MAG UNVERIFIED_CONTAM: hypothetical protein LVR29_13375 [Microcystis novacekii LVE1205-3]|jgi:hypothetical protein